MLYEFVSLLVRISFQRANPTFGNFKNKRPVVHLPECLRSMIEEEVLPRARKDTSAAFRDTVMEEQSVQVVLTEYKPMLEAYYNRVTQKDTEYFDRSDEMGMEQWLPEPRTRPRRARAPLPVPSARGALLTPPRIVRRPPATIVRVRAAAGGFTSWTSSTSWARGRATASRTSRATPRARPSTAGRSR